MTRHSYRDNTDMAAYAEASRNTRKLYQPEPMRNEWLRVAAVVVVFAAIGVILAIAL